MAVTLIGEIKIYQCLKKDKTDMTEDEVLALTQKQVMSILRKQKRKLSKK